MAIAEMQKVTIVGAKHLREQVVEKLAAAGVFQPVSPDTDLQESDLFQLAAVDTAELEYTLGSIEPAIKYLEHFQPKSAFDLGLFPAKAFVTPGEYAAWVKDAKWKQICEECMHIRDGIDRLQEQRAAIREQRQALLPWRRLTQSVKQLNQGRFTSFRLAIVPSELKQHFIHSMEGKPHHVAVAEEVNRRAHVVIASLRGHEAELEELLHQARAEKVELTAEVAPADRLNELQQKTEGTDSEIHRMRQRIEELAEERVRLMTVYDHFAHALKEKQAQTNASLSNYTFVLVGWTKTDDAEALQKTLSAFEAIEVIMREPSAKERAKIPIALSNRRFFKPFELVTELYGLPRYVEIDPTPFLAPFFALFLAFCLTDGGYGVLMAVIAFILPRRMEVGEGGRKLFSLLFISGLVTIVVGTITGGIFGIHLEQMPAFLAPIKQLALFNPMQEPMTFLVIALAVGVVHLVTGICIEMADNLRRGRVAAAMLDQCSWLVLIAGLLLAAIPFSGMFFGQQGSGATQMSFSLSPTQLIQMYNSFPTYSQVGVILALCGIAVLFVFAGRQSRSIGKRLAKGAYEVYGIIQLFADILSYSRLLALGLATSVIATVVNTIAGMAGGMPIVGPILFVLILIIGHIGNLLINALSGFIHTARLQFVEFFTKFYQSGGAAFEPLQREGKYTIVRQDTR